MTICGAYCPHGGVCLLEKGHEEYHDTGFCKFNDKEAIGKEEADAMLDPDSLMTEVFKRFT